jgi:hypothetical protein
VTAAAAKRSHCSISKTAISLKASYVRSDLRRVSWRCVPPAERARRARWPQASWLERRGHRSRRECAPFALGNDQLVFSATDVR